MQISVEIIEDSVSPFDIRLTTYLLWYHRFIHPHVLTHRAFSRNASSSRAIPSKRLRKQIRDNMAMPLQWGKNKKGMQATEELSGWRRDLAQLTWKGCGHLMLGASWLLEKCGLHKQIANRVLEPWSHISVLVSSTEWSNFFATRIHADAQPEIRQLATMMYDAQKEHTPQYVDFGEWHLPFITEEERKKLGQEKALRVSVARCARVSYLNHDGHPSTFDEDNELYKRLVNSKPMHASPFEHQATPRATYAYCNNFRGWHQLRKDFSEG